jgi:hypothetical protein
VPQFQSPNASTPRILPTQVASTLAALFLGVIVLAVLSILLTLTTVLPIMGVYGDWFWPWWFRFAIFDAETMTLGFLASLLVNFYLLILLARFVFRVGPDDRGLQKRGMFHIFDTVEFLFYILNALLGLAKRAITSILFQVLFMGRMDKSLMPRKHELWDKSYVSYLGYMQLDLYYSHPVLLTAVYEFLKMTSPRAAQRRSDVNVAQLRSSSGSWLRRATGGNSSVSLKSNAVFQALPNGSNPSSTPASPRMEMRRLKINGKGHAEKDEGKSGAGDANGQSSHASVSKLKARHHPTRGEEGGEGAAQLVNETNDNEMTSVSDTADSPPTSPSAASASKTVSPTSLNSDQRAAAAKRAAARLSGHARQVSIDSTVCVVVEESTEDRLRRRRARNRWLVAYTLMKNPVVMYERRTFGVPTHLRPKGHMSEPEVISAPSDRGSVDSADRPRASSFRAMLLSGASKAKAYAESLLDRHPARSRVASNPFAIDGFVEEEETQRNDGSISDDDDMAPLAEPATGHAAPPSSSSFLRLPSATAFSRQQPRPISFAEFAEEDAVVSQDVPSSEA